MKKEKTKEPDFDKFHPPTDCESCKGRGEEKDDYVAGGFFSGSYWTYKKCLNCNGTGKNIWTCIECKSLLNAGFSFWCSNKTCRLYALNVALGIKQD